MFKDKLKQLRQEKKLSQEELGKLIYVSRSAIAKWEQGRGMPNPTSMEDLARVFRVTKEELYDYEDVAQCQKKNKKIKIIFLVSFLLLLGISIPLCIWAILRPSSPYKNQDFFSKSILREYHLEGVQQPYYVNQSVVYQDTNYACKVERKSFYKEYAYYLADFLYKNDQYELLDLIHKDLDLLTYVHSYLNEYHYVHANVNGCGSYSKLQQDEIYDTYVLYYTSNEDKEHIYQLTISYESAYSHWKYIYEDYKKNLMTIELLKTPRYYKYFPMPESDPEIYMGEVHKIYEDDEVEYINISKENYKDYIAYNYYTVNNDKYQKTVINWSCIWENTEVRQYYDINIKGKFIVNDQFYEFEGLDSIQIEGVVYVTNISLEIESIEGKVIKVLR